MEIRLKLYSSGSHSRLSGLSHEEPTDEEPSEDPPENDADDPLKPSPEL